MIAMMTISAASATPPSEELTAVRLVTGLDGGSGSTLGPGGALYVTEGLAGRISRVDPQTGEVTTVASGLPKPGMPGYPFGGPVDVVFLGTTAYVLVAVVAPSDVVGIYRVDGPDSFTVVADIGTFSEQNPPRDPVQDPRGAQYALESYRGGFLVTDGHHNRVLRVTLDGEVSEVIAFGNTVPTGLAVSGPTVYLAEAGPVPHRPEDGKVVAFEPTSPTATELASGASLLVDVELGREGTLYALSQGDFPADTQEGSPALPNTGALLRVNDEGTFTVIIADLDQPTSLEFIGNTAYIVTLTGEIWTIDGVSDPP
jgi:sugar lactone lactonase YvrE